MHIDRRPARGGRGLAERARASRVALARCVWHLRAVGEAGVRVRAAPDVRRMVDVIADEAERIFAVDRVVVESFERAGAPVRAERHTGGGPGARGAGEVTFPLDDGADGLRGSICLAGPARGRFDATDHLLLAQYARGAGASLERVRLLRDAGEASLRREDESSVVSHDFRGPLGTIALGASMLRASFTPRGEEARAELVILDRVERSCARMRRALYDLQDVARVDAGAFTVDRRDARGGELLARASEEAAALARTLGVALRVDGAGAELALRVDRGRVLQALAYLVDHCLRATPRGGVVTLSAEPVEDGVRLSVADGGAAVNPEVLAHAFDRYWPGHRGARGPRRIRFFLARAIAEAHGGRAEARSEPGGGSWYSLLLREGTRREARRLT